MKSADSIFVRKTKDGGPDPKIERMEAENTRMKNVIAENLELKKHARTERSCPASRRTKA